MVPQYFVDFLRYLNMRIFFLFLFFPIAVFSQSLQNHEVEQLIKNKQFNKAKSVLQSHLEVKPNDLTAIELLGDVYGQEKKWDEAIEAYEKLVQTKPKNANYQYKYGGALGMKAKSVSKFRALGLIGDVEEAFLKAASLDPTHIDTRWALVHYYLHVPGIVGGSYTKAMRYAKELYALSPVDGYLAIGHVHEEKKEFAQAEMNYKQAVAVGGSKTCYTHLADLYVNMKHYNKAVRVLEEAYEKLKNRDILHKIQLLTEEHNLTSSLINR